MAYNIWGGYNSFSSLPQGTWVVESSGVDDYMEAATLGDLTASKIRVVLERVTWNTEGYLFSQAGSLSSSRELGLYIFGGNYGIILGGFNNTNVGSAAGNPITDVTVDVTVDYVANTLLFLVDGVAVYDGAIFSGNSRINGQELRVFARGGGAYAPAGTRVGNTQIYIDDILVRNYDFDNSSHGAGVVTVSEAVSSLDLIGVDMVTDGSAWVNVPVSSNDIATNFNLSQLAFTATIDNTAIENNATTEFELAPLSFSTVIDNTPLENSIATNFNLSELSFSAIVNNDNLTNNATIDFNLTPLNFSAVIDNTAVDNTVATNFAVSALQFSTQVLNGEFLPELIASNNIAQLTYNTSITQITYNTNIKGK